MRLRGLQADVALAVAVLAFGVVEILTGAHGTGSLVADLLAALPMCLSIAMRRRSPRAAAALVAAGGIAIELTGTPVMDLFYTFVAVIIVSYSLGRYTHGSERIALAGGLGGLLFTLTALDYNAFDGLFSSFVVGAGAFGGVLVQGHARMTRALAERTHELEALREASERDAMLDERRRIARELHDVVAHTVAVMVIHAGGARVQADRDRERALAALDQVDATGRETLNELDRLFGLLHEVEAPGGLADLPALVERTRAAGLAASLHVTGEPAPLDPDADLAAYRLVQEALTNTIKHGGPGATARVEVAWDGGGVDLLVTDTGRGLAGESAEGSRRGLVGMRERMSQYGGSVEAGPRAGGGFEVRARLPVAVREEVPA